MAGIVCCHASGHQPPALLAGIFPLPQLVANDGIAIVGGVITIERVTVQTHGQVAAALHQTGWLANGRNGHGLQINHAHDA